MDCVAVSVYILVSADYTENGQRLALYFKSFGKLDVHSLPCALFLLPCVVLAVLCVVAVFTPFAIVAILDFRVQQYSFACSFIKYNFFEGVACCFCILRGS